MIKVFKVSLLVLFSISLKAQNSDSAKWNKFTSLFENPYKSFEKSRVLGLQSSSNLSTSQISNRFIYPFLFGKKLESETINDNIQNTKNKQLHSETNNELQFINLEKSLAKSKPVYWYIKGGTHNRLYANASNDAFRLIFKGNTDTNEYRFNNGSYSNFRFNKLGFGVFYINEKKPKPYNLSFGVSAIQVANYSSIRTYEHNYLKSNEDSIEMGANYDAIFAKDGYGMAGEFSFNQKIDDLKNWGFSLKNWGFANFNKKASTYSAFGEYKFTGIYIHQMSRIKEEDYFQNQMDSISNPVLNRMENQSKLIWMAPITQIYYTLKKGRHYYQFSLKHTGTKALPVAEFRYFKFIRPSFLWAFSAGSIGQYYVNTDINWAINRQWFFQMSVFHLEALALPNSFGGLGGSYGLQFAF